MGKFYNYGYKGVYNGETAKDIANRKGISEKEDILDYMSSTELAANLFRITQTDEETLIREVKEEISVDIIKDTIKYYDTFEAQADGKEEGVIVKIIFTQFV